MKFWSLALRNLLRNRRRSLATVLALAIGSSAILLFGGYTANVRYSMQTIYVRTGGHLQIQHRDYFNYGSGSPASYGIPRYGQIVDAIRTDAILAPMVAVVSPVLQFGGVAGNYDAGVSRTILGTGFVPEDVNRLRQWNRYDLRDQRPRFALEGARPESAVIGQGVARVLLMCDSLRVPEDACPKPVSQVTAREGKALPADIAALAQGVAAQARGAVSHGKTRIELMVSQSGGAPNVAALDVVAAESQGFKELDELALMLPLAQAQKLVYGRGEPRATSILIQLEKTELMPSAIGRIEALLAKLAPETPLGVLSFEALNPYYVQTQQMFGTIFGFIFALIGGIVLFTVGNTMNAAVMERTVEIGTLRSLGLRQSGIRALFLTEGFVLGCVGALAGLMAAALLTWAFNAMELTWIPPSVSDAQPLSIILRGEYRMMIGTTLGLITIAVLSAWWPARRAAKLRIVDALRHV